MYLSYELRNKRQAYIISKTPLFSNYSWRVVVSNTASYFYSFKQVTTFLNQSQMTSNPPPSTGSITNDDQLAALEVSSHSLQRQVDDQREELTGIYESIDALFNAVAKARSERTNESNQNDNHRNGSVNWNHGESSGGPTGGIQTRFPHLDFPHFNREDPTGWIYKVEQFFHYQRTAREERVVLASFHLQDEALQWYQWYEKTQPNMQWEEFTQALCVHFGPSNYEDFDKALAKL